MKGTLLPLLGLALACGHPSSGKPAEMRRDDASSAGDAPATNLPPLTFGMEAIDGFAYRHRPGQAAFKQARDAEARGDWASVAASCAAALAADPDHLDAAYLLAVARAKQNQLERVIEPLAKAVAGDFAKWGQASLDQPALQAFLATPIGDAWRTRVDKDREVFAAMLARSLLVTSRGDVFAYDPQSTRWLRVTRTGGAIVGTLPVRGFARLAYVTREKDKTKHQTSVRLGLIDLASGRARLAVELPSSGSVRLAYNAKKLKRFVVRTGNTWQSVADEPKLRLLPSGPKDHLGYPADLADSTWLDITAHHAQLTRLGVPNINADWDDHALASALRIGSSHRVITVPAPGLIDGNTLVWSPDRIQLAFAAQLADTCKPGEPTAAAFVADAATGTVQELERATGGVAVDWVAERKVAVAGDKGVTILDLAGGPPIAVAGADGLLSPRRKPTCTPEPVGDEPVSDEESSEPVEDGGSAAP